MLVGGKFFLRSKGIPFHVGYHCPDRPTSFGEGRGLHKIYIAGGSFGQEQGRNAPFSPFKLCKSTKSMTISNYIAVGLPSQYIPFNVLQRLGSVALETKSSTPDKAEAFVRQTLFDMMGEEEKAEFAK